MESPRTNLRSSDQPHSADDNVQHQSVSGLRHPLRCERPISTPSQPWHVPSSPLQQAFAHLSPRSIPFNTCTGASLSLSNLHANRNRDVVDETASHSQRNLQKGAVGVRKRGRMHQHRKLRYLLKTVLLHESRPTANIPAMPIFLGGEDLVTFELHGE